MNTQQNYVGGGNYASPPTPQPSLISDGEQTTQLVEQIARLCGESAEEVWERIWQQLLAFYQVDIHQFTREETEPLVSVAERHDLLDWVYQVASAERLHHQTEGLH